jgi:hypothetical protein
LDVVAEANRRRAQNLDGTGPFDGPVTQPPTRRWEAIEEAGTPSRFGAPRGGEVGGKPSRPGGNQRGRCPQILRAGNRFGGETCGRSRRRRRQGCSQGWGDPLGLGACCRCSRCRAICVGDKWISYTPGQRSRKSGQDARLRFADRATGPGPPAVADAFRPEDASAEFRQQEQASPHNQLRCTQDPFHSLELANESRRERSRRRTALGELPSNGSEREPRARTAGPLLFAPGLSD